MKKHHKAVTVTNSFIIGLFVLLIFDCIFFINRQKNKTSLDMVLTRFGPMVEGDTSLIYLIMFLILTLIIGYGAIFSIKKNLQLNKNIKIKEQGLLQPITTKVIRFNLEYAGRSPDTRYYNIITSNGKLEFSSEPFKGKIIGYEPIKLLSIQDTPLKYNILEIESSINKLEKIQKPADVKYINKSSKLTKRLIGGLLNKQILSEINKCKEYLKEISKTTEFKNSYLQHKNHQIHIGDNITVYVDPNNPTIYQVDTDFLYN